MAELQEHVRDCKRDTKKVAPESKMSKLEGQEERTKMCEYCPKLFVKMADLRRHIRRMHTSVTCTSSAAISTATDELGSDPDVEIFAESEVSDQNTSIDIARKPTRPLPVVSGTKLSLVSLSGQSFNFGDKVVTDNISTVSGKVTSDTYMSLEKQKSNMSTITAVKPSAVKTSETPMTESSKRSYGVQVNMERIKVEHHKVVETVRMFKEGDTQVTRKEMHETKWTE